MTCPGTVPPVPSKKLRFSQVGLRADPNAPVAPALQWRRVSTEQLSMPKDALRVALIQRREPVSIDDDPNLRRSFAMERIECEKRKDVAFALEQGRRGAKDPAVLLDCPERCKPQVPLETGLIGRVDPR